MTRTLSLRSSDLPQIHKFGIGFDNMLNDIFRMSEQQVNVNYPPYNIVKQTDDKFYIEVATAGFKPSEISAELENNTLTIHGKKEFDENSLEGQPEYLHRGISGKEFDRVFTLAEHVEVIDAVNSHGILTVYLERIVPEEKKPKTIDIKHTN